MVLYVLIYTRGVHTGYRKNVGSAVAVWLCRDMPYRDRRSRGGNSSPRLTEFEVEFAP
jgi:hypothetical protein